VSRDDGPRWRQDARQRQREWDDQPGELVATATPDGQVEQMESAPTLRLSSRDAATYILAGGALLLSMLPQPYGRGFEFEDGDGSASEALRRWNGYGAAPVMDVRGYAGASALVRRLIRDGAIGKQAIRYTVGAHHEQGRSA
jgi:hypothetical protein